MQVLAAVMRGPKPEGIGPVMGWMMVPERIPKRVRMSKEEVKALRRADQILNDLSDAVRRPEDDCRASEQSMSIAMAGFHLENVIEDHEGPSRMGRLSGPWISCE